ncbi:helix-turn-helix domain-containing protein [uncultured Draconibacterium sp.]|uniref:helix-turn-helix domain-containing protein n=1 Tax=uncultured Draconibacterium sp. TaxID=1573823 RepID=UPI003260CF4E
MTENFTFDQLPRAVAILTKEVSELKQLLQQKREQQATPLEEQLLTVQEAADFLNLSVPTIYGKVSRGELPVMKRGKKLHFSSIDLWQYVKEGRIQTNAEFEAKAETSLATKRKGAR